MGSLSHRVMGSIGLLSRWVNK